jgi:hypothetical protein
LDVTLSVDGKVWSELLPTMGLLGGDYLGLAGRGDQYLAWPYEFPPNRIHSSVDGLTWTTSDIAVGMPPDSVFAYTDQVRWNGAQYVLYGSWVGPLEGGLTDANYMIARSCNGRVWHYTTLCSSSDPPNQVICQLSFASTAAMTVVVVSIAGFSDALLEGYVDTHIRYSADLVTWESAGSWDYLLTTLVVGDP